MFHSLTHRAGITQQQHRALPGISNTDLSRVADVVLGNTHKPWAPALDFGSYFHSAILEPEAFDAEHTGELTGVQLTARAQAALLARIIKRHRYPRHVCYRGIPEQSYTATHEATGLLVKVRPDLIIDSPKKTRRTLVDFKTTSCATLEQFTAAIEKYDYDRQGAFYADVMGAQRVVLIAVQKKPKAGKQPAVWVVELSAEQMAMGRKKYGKLLREVRETAGRMVGAGQLRASTTAGSATVTLAAA
ncbi:MAG: PD-(D/E)XK nuclease-like domain-containing protein [Hymenobacteraceae bacterium]|nr:PD-(D/E)XK nuclease-like domain-containing protein [Hymenobacteraceae bacterium]